jgi:hypothetical protein
MLMEEKGSFEVREEEIKSGCRTKGAKRRFPDLRSPLGAAYEKERRRISVLVVGMKAEVGN